MYQQSILGIAVLEVHLLHNPSRPPQAVTLHCLVGQILLHGWPSLAGGPQFDTSALEAGTQWWPGRDEARDEISLYRRVLSLCFISISSPVATRRKRAPPHHHAAVRGAAHVSRLWQRSSENVTLKCIMHRFSSHSACHLGTTRRGAMSKCVRVHVHVDGSSAGCQAEAGSRAAASAY